MLRLPDQEWSGILLLLDAATALIVPACCRHFSEVTATCEELVWRSQFARLLELRDDESSITLGDNGKPLVIPPVPDEKIGAKCACRLRLYLLRKQLSSLDNALRCAADQRALALVRILLKAGANPNAAADSGAHGVGFTQVGAFPLHLAAKRSNLEVLDALLAARADVDAADQNGRTGLMVASASGQVSACEWLIRHGAALDAKSHYGCSGLHHAAMLPRLEIVELLLRAGASPLLTDKEGQTPLHLVLKTVPRRMEKREQLSCDPSGHGDEYCYDRDISHGYSFDGAHEAVQDALVKDAVRALLAAGADVRTRDGIGRSVDDVLEMKRRPDLRAWLRGLVGTAALPAAAGAVRDDRDAADGTEAGTALEAAPAAVRNDRGAAGAAQARRLWADGCFCFAGVRGRLLWLP